MFLDTYLSTTLDNHRPSRPSTCASATNAIPTQSVAPNRNAPVRDDSARLKVDDAKSRLIEHVVAVHRGSLRRFLQRYERDPHCLEDLVQDTALEALRCAESFRGDSKPETWLFGIALNVVRAHIQRSSVRKLRFVSSDDTDADSLCEDHGHSLTDAMILRESVTLLTRELEKMPGALQQTFECLFVRGMQYREAAAELGVPIGTIRSRVSRIRELLTKGNLTLE